MDKEATRSDQVEAEAKVEVKTKVDQQAPMSPTAASGAVAATANGAMAPGGGPSPLVVYDVEHLATFSTSGSHETNNGNKANMDDDGADDGNRTTIATGAALPDKRPAGNHTSIATPKVALQRLFELEKLSGIWTQHMQIELRGELMLIIDCETNSVVERFSKSCVTRPEAFNHYNDIYNNIVVFIISQSGNQNTTDEKQAHHQHNHHQSSTASTASSSVPSDSSFESSQLESALEDSQQEQERGGGGEGELHIFQCVSHRAQQLVADILEWKSADAVNAGAKTTITATGDSQSSGKQATTTTTTPTEKKSAGQEKQQPANEKTKENMKSSNLSPGTSKPPVVVTSAASGCGEIVPIVNVNVKETVQVFNQIAALREKSSKPTSPTNRSSSEATASNLSPATSAGNGSDHQAGKLALSPGGQLYKQRSIRATLTPKFASNEGNQATSTSAKVDSSSASSSSSSSEPKAVPPTTTAYGAASRHHHQLANGNNNSDQLPIGGKQQVMDGAGLSSSPPQVRSSSTNHHYQQQQQQPQHHQHHHQNGNTHHHHNNNNHKSSKSQQQQKRTPFDSTRSSHASSSSQSQLDQVTTNESYVSVLNHCFDDIEKFIIRLQQAVTAFHELQANSKRKLAAKRSNQNNTSGQPANNKTGVVQLSSADLALLSARARGPSEDDYFEILSKFKLAFNLLAKLKGCIHEPNAPELVHFLFTPLAIIIESARNASPPIDPTLVGIPYLNQDALDLLSNCCTSKESDMWLSLGPNWTQTIDMSLLKGSRLPSSFQPIFSDGWAPIIGELELIGLVAPPPANGGNSSGGPASSVATTATVAAAELTATRLSPPGGHSRAPGAVPYEDVSYSAPPLPLEQNYAPGKLNGKSDQKKRNYRSQHAPIEPPMVEAYHHPQVDTYGYLQTQPDQDYHQLRSRRMNQTTKQSSRLAQDYGAKSGSNYGYGSSSGAPPMLASHHFPPMNLHHHHQHPADMDGGHLVDTDTIVDQSDDYSELHGHYDSHHHHHQQQQHQHEGAPGPSHPKQHHHHHNHHQQLYPRNSNDFNHSKRQGISAASNRKQSNLYNQAPFAAASADDHQSDYLLSEAEQEAMLLDLGPAQTEWFYELQSRGAMIVRVLFTREANNDKELSVRRGEVLEVLDDTRKWWRARNIDLQVAHVPHTIVAIMQGYQTLDELLASNPGDEHSQPSLLINSASHLQHHHHSKPGYGSRSHHNQRAGGSSNYSHQWREAAQLDKRNSKSSTSGAFRYF